MLGWTQWRETSVGSYNYAAWSRVLKKEEVNKDAVFLKLSPTDHDKNRVKLHHVDYKGSHCVGGNILSIGRTVGTYACISVCGLTGHTSDLFLKAGDLDQDE